jgi:hypothetical protein
MANGQAPAIATDDEGAKNMVLQRYDARIQYYWKSSQYNKRSYKYTRYLLIILGALVTLVASLSSAKTFPGILGSTMAVLTPLLAACMAIVSGISQAFQWGAAWSDQVITATRLEKDRNRIAVTPASQLDPVKEMQNLDDAVLSETQGFFQRLFGSGGPPKAGSNTGS